MHHVKSIRKKKSIVLTALRRAETPEEGGSPCTENRAEVCTTRVQAVTSREVRFMLLRSLYQVPALVTGLTVGVNS